MLNLCSLLEDSARQTPERDAVVLGATSLTYGEVERRANQVAALLASRGIGRGDRVALSCPNVPDFPVVYYGILKTGATVVPLNVLLRAREIAYHLEDAHAAAYFCFEGTPELPMAVEGRQGFEAASSCQHFFLITSTPGGLPTVDGEVLADALEQQPVEFEHAPSEATDTAVILYTSGTTGRPKGAELTHANMVLNALTANRLFDMQPGDGDVHLLALPLFHSFGQTVQMNAGFAVGATLVLMPRFDARAALEVMQRDSVSIFAGVPTMYWALLQAVTDEVDVAQIAANLRLAISGGAALSVEMLKQVEHRFGVQVREGYGLSETSPLATFSDPSLPPRPGSIGKPVWGVQLALVDDDWQPVPDDPDSVGEIAVKGHNVMKGYFQRPGATGEVLRDGWFRTGDLARRDKDGFYYLVDRVKDLIIRGGYNVYPREVEEVLMTHPAVSLVAVAGVPDDQLGEEVKAWVVPQPGFAVTPQEIVEWARSAMAPYKYPRTVELVDTLPTTATGKILKRELPGVSAGLRPAPAPR